VTRLRAVTYGAVVLGCLALAPALDRSGWTGSVYLHTLHETVAVMLALGVAAIALVRFYSRKSDTFLLLGAAFAGTAFLDGYHAVATSKTFAASFQATELSSTSPWSWIASRLFLSVFLWISAPRRGSQRVTRSLDERTIYLTVLASHILLSITVVPGALTSFYFALTRQFARHRRLNRVFLPIWLYVSVTGVVIFFMLRRA